MSGSEGTGVEQSTPVTRLIRQGQALGAKMGATVGLHRFMVGVFEIAV
jgi:hypothetical protein